jgi:hypothetical protein
VLRALADPPEGLADFLNKGDGTPGIVLGDPIGDFFQITFDEAGKFETRDYSFVPAASARA